MMFVFDHYFGIEDRRQWRGKYLHVHKIISVVGIYHFKNVIDDTLCSYVICIKQIRLIKDHDVLFL